MNNFLETHSRTVLTSIIVFAFLVRLAGINYGLPLWLIDDEPPFILGAFKMMELKTLVPALHTQEFQSVLYYPPLLSYLYLIPFTFLLGIKFFLLGVPMNQFINYIVSDLSGFFLIARLINVISGTISVYLIYRISFNIFKDKFIGMASAFFLGTSLLHISLSMTGRHWLPAAFVITLAIFFLSKEGFSKRMRYLTSGAIIALGVGVSTIVAPAIMLLPLWYLFYEGNSFRSLMRERYLYYAGAMLVASIIFIYLLYPGSFGFRVALSGGAPKFLLQFLLSPLVFLRLVAVSEPILMLSAMVGFVAMFFERRNFACVVASFIFIYSGIFYLAFRYEHRFTLVLFPVLVILAGYGLVFVYKKFTSVPPKVFLVPCLILLIFTSLRFSYLVNKNDTRILAREWFEKNIPRNSKVLVYARLLRLNSTPEAILEQEKIDPGSLRKVDGAERVLGDKVLNTSHALNLHFLENSEFYDNLSSYFKQNSYQYLILSTADKQKGFEQRERMSEVAHGGILLKSFVGVEDDVYTHAGSNFDGNPFRLFFIKEFGPPISIYKIQ